MSFKYVKVHFGPDNTHHSLIHKPQRLNGFKNRLQKLGFRVDLFEVPYINYCMMELCGHEVFRCNITNLKFNINHERDPVCQRAIAAVVDACSKFKRARVCLWIMSYIEHQTFRRTKYSPSNYWPIDYNIQHLPSCQDCVNCCGLLVSKISDKEPEVTNIPEERNPPLIFCKSTIQFD